MRTISQDEFGGPEVLRVAEVDKPAATHGGVLIRVRAAGVNPVDAVVRSGAFPLLGEPPFVLGWDVSGVVEATDPVRSGRFQPGDEVFGMPLFPRQAGGYAEYVSVPSHQVVRKPAGLDHVHAAALPLVGLTAWQALVDGAGVAEGQRVLVHGAAGGVGHVAVQIAKARGAHVIGTASAAKHGFLRGLGVDETVDYHDTDLAAAVGQVDTVFDTVGGYGDASVPLLRPGGTFVTVVNHRDGELTDRVTAAGRRFVGVSVEPDRADLEQLVALVEAGKLTVAVEQTLPLEEAAKAHELIGSGRTRGKIVLTV